MDDFNSGKKPLVNSHQSIGFNHSSFDSMASEQRNKSQN